MKLTWEEGIVVRYDVEAGGRSWIGMPEVMLPLVFSISLRCCWMGKVEGRPEDTPGKGLSPWGRKLLFEDELATLEEPDKRILC